MREVEFRVGDVIRLAGDREDSVVTVRQVRYFPEAAIFEAFDPNRAYNTDLTYGSVRGFIQEVHVSTSFLAGLQKGSVRQIQCCCIEWPNGQRSWAFSAHLER